MANAIVGLCTLDLVLHGVGSLKEKRRILQSLLKRVQNQFNASAAEIDYHDLWGSARIAVAVVSNSSGHASQMIDAIIRWIERNYSELEIGAEQIEIL